MWHDDRIVLESLNGEILSHVDQLDDEIMLTTVSGREIRIYHSQDCCETVSIEDTEGDWHRLIGKSILECTHDEERNGYPPPAYPDSWTRTELTFKVDNHTVVSRWIGESNGYYSESVDISDVTKQTKSE